ncbi:mycofactocin biosynthesis chaperone MftB [Hoyosella sp. YIM 151337]|uniref:mycofactocin biosynthesis chaperone MftB n=1 Tax=Hoyosella sp. YIM 151337 TaxID=2992742 RepID=UPI0022355425|nr:mycofactocin biosynthesis chaperone MftB [Hoyosella sp. YIM 151337]MCW4353652.1 mycofactocin biosynthesis chaperone MftB [Hoyosella sp. YIM 151337]
MSTFSDEAFLGEGWALSPSVALRPEPFGALAYHFGNRRLTFLKRPELVELVRALSASDSIRGALGAAEIPAGEWPAYLKALRGLAAADMIRPQATSSAATGAAS